MRGISCKYRKLNEGVHVYMFDTLRKARKFAKYYGGDLDKWSCLPELGTRYVVYLSEPVHVVVMNIPYAGEAEVQLGSSV